MIKGNEGENVGMPDNNTVALENWDGAERIIQLLHVTGSWVMLAWSLSAHATRFEMHVHVLQNDAS
jgi:hypothetical protein